MPLRASSSLGETQVSRSSLAMTAVTLGALALSAAVLIEAFAVVDRRATQILIAEPQAAPPAKKSTSSSANRTIRRDGSQAAHGSDPNSARAAPVKAETVGSAALPAGVPESNRADAALDPDKKARAHEHHRRHAGRSVRRHSQEPGGPPQPPSPATPDTSRSAFFFPFR